MTAAQFLRALFTLDPGSPAFADLAYLETGLGLGTKLWWPPLNAVWAHRDAENAWTHDPQSWREARELLDRLHAEYQAHKQRTT
jgi:hypothetical protein